MKKLLIALLFGVCGYAHAVNPIYGTVQITTTTTLAPALQNGAIRIASGTIRNLNVTFGVKAATGNFSGAVTAGSFSGSGASLTGVIFNQDTLQTGATFFTSSGTVNNLNVPTTLQLNGQSGTAGQSIQSGGSGSIPTWVNVPSAILTTTSTWTANQTISSATVTTLNSTTINVTTITPTFIVGATNGINKPVADFGYYVSSFTAAAGAPFPTSTNYGDVVALTLSAGNWMIYANLQGELNGATVVSWQAGISTTAGNSSSGLSIGQNLFFALVPSTTRNSVPFMPQYVQITGSTTYYLKLNSNYSVATPIAYGGLTAIRMP